MPRGWERQLRDAADPPDRHFSTRGRVPSPENSPNQWNATESSRFGLPLDPVAFQVGLVVPVAVSDQTRPPPGTTESRLVASFESREVVWQ
jgi:hypothetical protein